jgi:hypothetical protein
VRLVFSVCFLTAPHRCRRLSAQVVARKSSRSEQESQKLQQQEWLHHQRKLAGMTTEFDCPACQCTYNEPLQLAGCAHRMCKQCVQSWTAQVKDVSTAHHTHSIRVQRECT